MSLRALCQVVSSEIAWRYFQGKSVMLTATGTTHICSALLLASAADNTEMQRTVVYKHISPAPEQPLDAAAASATQHRDAVAAKCYEAPCRAT
jgi:hypothetical protein